MDDTKKICVVMGDTRAVYFDERAWLSFPSLSFTINERFARSRGWEFRYERYQIARMPWGNLESFSTASRQHRASPWLKLMAVDKALGLGFDVVIWIDSDCIFYNHDADWSDVLTHLNTHHFVGWVDKPFYDDEMCSGFFAVRNLPEVRNLLKTLWLNTSQYHWNQFYEQADLNAFFKRASSEWLKLIDEPMFELVTEHQRLLHIASFDSVRRVPTFVHWLKSRNIGVATIETIQRGLHETLDVDLYDAYWSGIQPSTLDRVRRVLWSLRSFGRRTAKKLYRRIRPLR